MKLKIPKISRWLIDGLFRADSTFSLWNVQFSAKFCPNRNQPDVVRPPIFIRTGSRF
ncbi:hypothetical protein B0H10DRAFT_2138425 [Mycena sp. CBHHK59/15]|nr:hypothetical protein B0H10DRAFT_2138425 [Mycena sp. CBHHK59/15]